MGPRNKSCKSIRSTMYPNTTLQWVTAGVTCAVTCVAVASDAAFPSQSHHTFGSNGSDSIGRAIIEISKTGVCCGARGRCRQVPQHRSLIDGLLAATTTAVAAVLIYITLLCFRDIMNRIKSIKGRALADSGYNPCRPPPLPARERQFRQLPPAADDGQNQQGKGGDRDGGDPSRVVAVAPPEDDSYDYAQTPDPHGRKYGGRGTEDGRRVGASGKQGGQRDVKDGQKVEASARDGQGARGQDGRGRTGEPEAHIVSGEVHFTQEGTPATAVHDLGTVQEDSGQSCTCKNKELLSTAAFVFSLLVLFAGTVLMLVDHCFPGVGLVCFGTVLCLIVLYRCAVHTAEKNCSPAVGVEARPLIRGNIQQPSVRTK